jgi:(p)ppGpp synthase/HD superfamily hydrolase
MFDYLPVIERAKKFATEAHLTQVRKYTNEPYVVHTSEVADIVSTLTWATEEMIAAAHLHDVLEDQPQFSEALYNTFPPAVTDMVECLTDHEKTPGINRYTRKKFDVIRLSKSSREVQTIKCADYISNTKSIVQHDLGFAAVYIPEIRWSLINLTKADDRLRGTAWMQILDAEKTLRLR